MAIEMTLVRYGGTYTCEHSLLSPSGRMSGRALEAAKARERERAGVAGAKAAEWAAKIRSGEFVDPTDLNRRARQIDYEIQQARTRIESHEGQIRFYTSIGMGKRGKIRPKFARIIAEYEGIILGLRETIRGLEAEL